MNYLLCHQSKTCLILATVNQLQLRLPLTAGGFTVAQAIAELLAAKAAANRSQRYLTGLGYYLRQFAKGREDRPLAEFTSADIEAWMARYPGAYSRQTWLMRLSTLFAFAVRRGHLDKNPCTRIERVKVDKLPPKILTPAHAARFLQSVPGVCRAYLILGMYAGVRPEEIMRADWGAVNLDTKTIAIDGKTRQRRIVPLEPKAVKLLQGCVLQTGPLAPSLQTLNRWKRAARAGLGLKRWPQDLLRHTAASYLLALHGDAGKVATMLGNSSSILLTHYHEPVTAADCAAFWG
jgi:integrase